MTALSYHAYRLQTNLHAEFDGNRQRIAAAELAVATVERTADGIAVIAPSDLMATFRTQPADAWAMLATLTPAQLTIQAIDTACYLLDVEGRDISWSSVLETWTKRLALIAEAKAEVEEVQGDCEMITRVDTDALNDTAFQVWHTAYANADDARIAAVTRYVTAQAEPFPGDDEAERDAATVRLLQVGLTQLPACEPFLPVGSQPRPRWGRSETVVWQDG